MKALLTTNYIYIDTFRGYKKDYQKHLEFKKWVENNKGKEVEIDTTYLFDNQYNTKDGYRIYDCWIDKMINDVRTDKKCFFVKHPSGKDPIKKVNFTDHLKNERFLSCSSVNGNYYRISRRSSIEFILVGSEIYTKNGIGYETIKESDLSDNEIKMLKYCADRILNNKNTSNNTPKF